MNIPYAAHSIDDEDIAAVIEVLKSETLTTGPKVAEFESALCAATGAKYAVSASSGAAALHIATLAAGIQPGDEAIVPAITFAATANCVLYCGGTPVFVDVDPDTLLVDMEDVRRKVTNRTRVILPVHFGGELCDIDACVDFSAQHGLSIIQDSAHSLGSTIRGKGQGEYPGQQIWSFHPAKTITTGEGGAVTTNDESLYKALLRFRTHGITRDAAQFVNEKAGGWYYEMLDLGYNYRLTDIQCALGISQLKKLSRFSKRRSEIVAYYDSAFAGFPLKVQQSPEWSTPTRHLYTIRLEDKHHRREVYDKLCAKGIGANVHYIPVYRLPYYEKMGYPRGLCPVAEDAYERLITLPLFATMTDEMVEYVVNAVKEALC